MGILRRLREWREDKNGTLIGPDIEADSVNTDKLSRVDTLIDSATSFNELGFGLESEPNDVSSTSYVSTDSNFLGGFSYDRVPDGATLYANHIAKANGVPDGETANFRPVALELNTPNDFDERVELTELEVTIPDSEELNPVESGWQEITSLNVSNNYYASMRELEAKVSGGTLTTSPRDRYIVLFEWRVD